MKQEHRVNNWFITNLGEIASFIRGVTFPKGSRLERYETGTIAVATTKAAQQQGIEHDKLYFIPKSFVKHSEQFLLPNDIVISIANSLDLVGRVTFATKKDEDITWGAFLGVIRANPELIYPYFLYSFLITAETKQYFRKNARTTTNISNISSDSILSLRIPVPPLAEQKRIVKKIEELFGVIDEQVKKLEATQEALISYRQSILQQAFSGHQIIKKVKDVGNVVTGSTPSTTHPEYYGDEYPFYKPTDLNQGYSTDKAVNYVSQKGFDVSRQLPEKSILVTCIGATIGKTGLIHQKGICNQQINAIIPSKEYLSEFVYFYAVSPQFQNAIKSNASATTLPILNKKNFEQLPFPYLSLPEQKAIVKKIETAFAFADKAQETISASLEQAKQLKQSILKQAFEGKLVPQDPNDKPIDLSKIKKDK